MDEFMNLVVRTEILKAMLDQGVLDPYPELKAQVKKAFDHHLLPRFEDMDFMVPWDEGPMGHLHGP